MNAFLHETLIDRWLAARAPAEPPPERVALLLLALQAIFARLHAILGELLVVAIFERGLEAVERDYPSLAKLDWSWIGRSGSDTNAIVRAIAGLSTEDRERAARGLLIEIVNVIDLLTSGALLPTLEEELDQVVALPPPSRARPNVGAGRAPASCSGDGAEATSLPQCDKSHDERPPGRITGAYRSQAATSFGERRAAAGGERETREEALARPPPSSARNMRRK